MLYIVDRSFDSFQITLHCEMANYFAMYRFDFFLLNYNPVLRSKVKKWKTDYESRVCRLN